MTLKICVAQLNFVVGDMQGNAQKIIDCAQKAYADGVKLVLTPELSICGYAAEDLFLRSSFIQACDDALKTVAQALSGLKGLHVVVGHPVGDDARTKSVAIQRRFNMASVCQMEEWLPNTLSASYPITKYLMSGAISRPAKNPASSRLQVFALGS